MTLKKSLSLLFLAAIYILAFTLGIMMFYFMTDINELLRLLVAVLTAVTVVYIFGLLFGTTSMVDPFWSFQTPVLLGFLMFYWKAWDELGAILYFLVFTFWAFRLTLNFCRNYTGLSYEDWRYQAIRKKTGKLYFLVSYFGLHVMTALIVFVASIPMYLYILNDQDFGLWQMIGLALMAVGAYYQTQADAEMHHFRKMRGQRTEVYDHKLWKYSRHPNYFGEMVLWFGVTVVLIAALPKWYYSLCSVPVIVIHIFTSRIADKHYSSYKPDYAVYMKNTYMLLPIPGKKKYSYLESDKMKWVTIWGNAQSKVRPDAAEYARNLTLRYPVFVPFDGKRLKITLDNFCVDEDAPIEAVTISRGSSLSDEMNEDPIYLTFGGERSFFIPAHKDITSDPVIYPLKSDEYLIISIYIKDCCNLTGGVDITGPLSKGYFAYGNQLLSKKLDINTSKSTSWVYFLSNVHLYTEDSNEAVICFGDSITSQDWPDDMELALREMGIRNVAVVRKAVSGTRILRQYECITYQSYGLKGKNRFMHEVGSVLGAKKIIIQHGINDIIHPVGEDVNVFRPMSDLPSVEDLANGMKYYASCAEKMNLKVYYGTLLPIYGWRTYAPFREELKNSFNEWIMRESNVIAFENEIGTLRDGIWYFNEGMDSGDHLHPSKDAYKKMGRLAAEEVIKE